jgi:transcriptional regulator with XRE-family HTH domain
MINYDIRQRVKDIASRQGKSQTDVMKGIHKTKSQWSQTLKNPRLDVVIAVARLLNCSVTYLIGEAESDKHTETFAKCPNCGKVWEITIKTE